MNNPQNLMSKQEIVIGNQMTLAKQVLKDTPILNALELVKAQQNFGDWLERTQNEYKYFMLLSEDARDFTLFHCKNGEENKSQLSQEVFSLMAERTGLYDCGPTETEQGYEFWRRLEDGTVYFYLFFPYSGLIELEKR